MKDNFDTIFNMNRCINKNDYNWDINVKGSINEFVKDKKIRYIAACPADYKYTFTGSGLPFQNQLQAFENTPNIGIITLSYNNTFNINLMYPNSYQVGLGSVLLGPTLYLQYYDKNENEKIITIKLGNNIPYRNATYPNGRGRNKVGFYDTQFTLVPRTQEQILRSSKYPNQNQTYDNFWGLRPPK